MGEIYPRFVLSKQVNWGITRLEGGSVIYAHRYKKTLSSGVVLSVEEQAEPDM